MLALIFYVTVAIMIFDGIWCVIRLRRGDWQEPWDVLG